MFLYSVALKQTLVGRTAIFGSFWVLSDFCFSQQSYSEPVDVKASPQPQMMNSKQSVFHGPAQAHSALYLSSHYHQQPGMNPHITAMHANIPRNIAPKPNNQMPVTVSIANMAVSPPPPLQISPPLHQHLNIQQHQPISMQQSIGNQLPMQVQSALHSPTMQQVSWSFSVLWGIILFSGRAWGGESCRSWRSERHLD